MTLHLLLVTRATGMVRVALALLASIAFVSDVRAQQPDARTAPTTAVPSASPRLAVSVLVSRPQVMAGSGLGVVLTLTNIGRDSTIFVTERSVALTLPPEFFDAATGSTYTATFPTKWHKPAAAGTDSFTVALKPGSTYAVPFTYTPLSRLASNEASSGSHPVQNSWIALKSVVGFLFFIPGEYQVATTVEYWTNPARPPGDYYTVAQTSVLHVTAPQAGILLGSAIGGLLAYLLFPRRRTREIEITDEVVGASRVRQTRHWTVEVGRKLWGALAAMLWSSLVTVLLSRLSEAQFVLKVSVTDFWGAVTIGFVAQYAGSKWLDKIVSPGGQESRSQTATPPPEPPPSRAASPATTVS